ncbi:MAG TPA: hypothetical protein VKK79_08150 [Candidatus Lokiarchaeia archaeon]|nr:hypothetical protein [Candidatus Lokiarchaeia archaeon]
MEMRRNPTDLIAELKNVEAERDQILHDLTERVKELQCLYRLGIIIDEMEDIEGMFREFVEFMPAA